MSSVLHTRVIYGWIIPAYPFHEWLEDIDWDTPTGAILVDEYGEEVAVGPEMISIIGDELGTPEKYVTFTEEEANSRLSIMLADPGLQQFVKYLKGDPKFHTFVKLT